MYFEAWLPGVCSWVRVVSHSARVCSAAAPKPQHHQGSRPWVDVGAAWGQACSDRALQGLPAASLSLRADRDLRRALWALHLPVALPVSSLLRDRGAGGLGIAPHFVCNLAMESGRRAILHSLVQMQSVPSAQP